jgi:hypothetical protein
MNLEPCQKRALYDLWSLQKAGQTYAIKTEIVQMEASVLRRLSLPMGGGAVEEGPEVIIVSVQCLNRFPRLLRLHLLHRLLADDLFSLTQPAACGVSS